MRIASAVLWTILCAAGPGAPGVPGDAVALPVQRQVASGIVIAADIEGRLTIHDDEGRLVVQLDKPAGRRLPIALEPGTYELRLAGRTSRRAQVRIREGQQVVIDLARFAPRGRDAPPRPVDAAPRPSRRWNPRDARHRVEARVGAWGRGTFDDGDDRHHSGTVRAAIGAEYLNFVARDVGIGIGFSSLVRAQRSRDDWQGATATQSVSSIPVALRWYPIRRLTPGSSVEPYITAAIGPVLGVDTIREGHLDADGWHHDRATDTHSGATIGGRLGGGLDVHLGSIFTIGVAGAWNWDAGFSDTLFRGDRPRGAEVTLAFGWNFGR